MQPVSAADALGLALTRTRSVLAPGRVRPGRFLKLALVAAFTQATFLSLSMTYPLQGGQMALLSSRHRAGQQAFATGGLGPLGAAGLGILLAVLVLLVLFSLAYLYAICRCRATLFSLVLTRGVGSVREAWRSQSRSTWRYLGTLVMAGLVYCTLLAAVLGPFLVRLVRLVGAAGPQDVSPQIGSLMLTFAGLAWLVLPIWIAFDALLQDFVLPCMVLEPEQPLGAAFARLAAVGRRAPGQLMLFLLLRAVVAFAVALALGIAMLVVLGVFALGELGVGWLLYRLLWSGSLGAHAIFFAAVAGMACVLFALYLLCVTAIYGVTGTFKACYGACFYAGYYPELALRLDPEAAALPGQPEPPSLLPQALW